MVPRALALSIPSWSFKGNNLTLRASVPVLKMEGKFSDYYNDSYIDNLKLSLYSKKSLSKTYYNTLGTALMLGCSNSQWQVDEDCKQPALTFREGNTSQHCMHTQVVIRPRNKREVIERDRE